MTFTHAPDFLNTERLSHAVRALEDYVTTVATPVANGSVQDELLHLRAENSKLHTRQAEAAARLEALMQTVLQKGVAG